MPAQIAHSQDSDARDFASRTLDYRDVAMLLIDPKQGIHALRVLKPKPSRFILTKALRFLKHQNQKDAVRDLEDFMTTGKRGAIRAPIAVGETRPFRAQQNRTIGKDGKEEWGPPGIWLPVKTLGVQVRGQIVDVSALDGVIEVRFTRKPAVVPKDGE